MSFKNSLTLALQRQDSLNQCPTSGIVSIATTYVHGHMTQLMYLYAATKTCYGRSVSLTNGSVLTDVTSPPLSSAQAAFHLITSIWIALLSICNALTVTDSLNY